MGNKSNTPALDRFGLDLTVVVEQGKFAPLVGRRVELERILTVLACRSQNNPILLGEPGVGKRALVRGLAQRYADEGLVKRVVAVSLDQMVAGTKSPVEFREALQGTLNEVSRAKNIVLFFDNLAPLAAPRTEESFHAACLLRAALCHNAFRAITVATPKNYQTSVAIDVVLGHHFRPILVPPLGRDETLAVLRSQKTGYESQHLVQIADEALEAAVDLAEQFLTDRCLPGKALHVVDEAGALVRLRYLPSRPRDLNTLEEEIERLNLEKEAAVAEQDFGKASGLRDQAQRLKEQHQKITERWQEQTKGNAGFVDRQVVAEVIGRMTGKPISPV